MLMHNSTDKTMPRFASAETAASITKGALNVSPGQSPRFGPLADSALKGRPNGGGAPSGRGMLPGTRPRALPWAIVFCPVGAAAMSPAAKRAVLEQLVNANLEGLGYGG